MALRDKNPDYENIIKQSVNYIIDETKHLKKVSYGFLDLSKLDELTPETFDLRALVRDEVFKNQQVYAHINFSLAEEPQESQQKRFTVILDKFKIKQVLKNLISNSIEAVGEKKGEITLSLKYGADRVLIVVKDNGIGMDEKGLSMVYNIDYSTKQIGTGLGLFIVKRIIDLHRGTIDIESEKNKGTRVIMELPVTIK
jgi:signal transduction histidine kinase